MSITLTSPAFGDDEIIPRQFTCDGDNVPPPLQWSPGPDGTRSFALTMEDPDAAGGTFTHWVLYDIPARVTHWPSGWSGKTMLNSFGRSGYGGPCPPPGDRPHGYVFSVHAVDVTRLELSDKRIEDLRAALSKHSLSVGQLVGRYER
jgi:Raf kinase inhibitor-like YbhB/YbcL family protein